MPRSSSSSAGCITRSTTATARTLQLSTWRSLSTPVRRVVNDHSSVTRSNTWQTKTMRRAGTCLGGATCHSRSIPRRMRPTSKPSIATGGTQHSGARLASCITRSTSTEMHWMHTPARYASTRTSPKSGTTWELWYVCSPSRAALYPKHH